MCASTHFPYFCALYIARGHVKNWTEIIVHTFEVFVVERSCTRVWYLLKIKCFSPAVYCGNSTESWRIQRLQNAKNCKSRHWGACLLFWRWSAWWRWVVGHVDRPVKACGHFSRPERRKKKRKTITIRSSQIFTSTLNNWWMIMYIYKVVYAYNRIFFQSVLKTDCMTSAVW